MRASILTVVMATLWATAADAGRLALHPLTSQGASADAMQQLDASVRIELSRVPGLEVVGAAPKCKGEPACLAAFGRALGASEVLAGDVRALPDSYSVTLRLFDVATGKETASATESVNRDVEEMVAATRALVVRLKDPSRYAGRVVVQAPAGGVVKVNGKSVGTEPLVVAPGTLGVQVALGGQSVESWVDVRFEQTAKVVLASGRLDVSYEPWKAPPRVEFSPVSAPPKPDEVTAAALAVAPEPVASSPPPAVQAGWPTWPAYAGIGVGVALFAGGVVQQVRAGAMGNELAQLQQKQTTADDRRLIADRAAQQQSARTSGAVLLGAGAALAVGGGVYLLLAPPAGPDHAAGVAVAGKF